MADTTLVRSEVDHSRLATGYKLRSHGADAVPLCDVVTVGAGAAYSTPRDTARYLAALMGGGTNEHGSVLKPATLTSMFAAQYQPDPRIPGMGLAFWRRNAGGHRVVEHLGVMPGFDSLISVAPDDGVGVMAFTNGTHGGTGWIATETSTLVNRLLGVPNKVIRTNVPQRPEVWDELCGWYYLPGPLTDVRLRAVFGAGVEVFVRRGQLLIRILSPIPALYKGFPLHPDDDTDPYAFRIDFSEFGFGTFPVVFSREPETGTMAIHFELMPLSAHKRPRGFESESMGRRCGRRRRCGDPRPETADRTAPTPYDLARSAVPRRFRCRCPGWSYSASAPIGICAVKASTLFCQPSSSGPLMPVTSTLPSATLTRPLPCSRSFMMGMTRCHLAISSSVGSRPVFLSGCGANSVVRTAYFVPGGRLTLLRKRRIAPIGLPMRPGELKRYRSAGSSSFGLASRMCWTLIVTFLAANCLLNSSATRAPFPYAEA
jgi:Beta-lactamase